ncbi:UNVERIFIED_CONTAM: hypothetical protein PYX00_006926 [Menopon gallinae]|uniref:Erythroid differentiation-related factor 1 n=1 Tax=Menopon gallinae TaxID=328185 RepID=A0AAW2HH43_9NEOP
MKIMDATSKAATNVLCDKQKPEEEKVSSCYESLDLESVKSAAVVKYSAAEAPALYTRLRCNTNLNLPPSNWLSSTAETYGLQSSLVHRSGFSSFRMAHMFPDCIGQVDVVSDAENIKKLLKIPYSRGSVSMMIHRIENTLLIDEFDIHKYLLREAESQWEWFKKFFFEHIMQPVSRKDILMHHKDNSRNALQQKSLTSKFLYHSLVFADDSEMKKRTEDESLRIAPPVPIPLPYKKTDPSLPEPKVEEEVPDPTSNHKFSRNVVWTFEDIQMLLGTDMPIFGGGTHPCISLRLRDMSKPINVLTGMDYWLDNLMCNVPEVVMCYHLNGIVQKYELIKTEDLPHLDNSKFSPKVIRDIAQNILSFLKANATKAGHTYWLFKGKDDDVVKLYDLTSLCTDVMEEKGQTPFTVPVAMLLYRVARNMKNSSDGRRQAATIRMLLQNCISLLSPEKYAGIVTSAHYMMADLYIPSDINPKSPQIIADEEETDFQQQSQTGSGEDDSKHDDFGVKSLSLSSMSEMMDDAEYIPPSPPPIGNDVLARCEDGLKHVIEGLRCLQFLNEGDDKDQKMQPEEGTEPEMAKPFQTIPMPYQPLHQGNQDTKKKSKRRKDKKSNDESDKSLLCKPKGDAVSSWQNLHLKTYTWNIHLKTLLYEKAYLICATLLEKAYSNGKFGLWLRYIRLVLKTSRILKNIRPDLYNDGVESYVFGPAADAFFMVVQNSANMAVHNEDYVTECDFEREIHAELQSMGLDKPDENDFLFPPSLVSLEELLLCSEKCYKRALQFETEPAERANLQRRIGNIQNELGVFYMNQAAAKYQQMDKGDESKSKEFKDLCTKSQNHLEEGIRAFECVKDEANLALLHSNTGRLMRLKAHFQAPAEDDEDDDARRGQEQYFYGKAIASYQKALQILGERKYNPVIWDSVNWELSTALYSMASFLQDYPSCIKNQEEAEREVIDTLLKALKYCDLETPGPRQPVYQFRSAMIHHRLASLYHKSYRTNCEEESRRKKIIQLCKLHYEKSANLLLFLEHPAEYLRVQLERVALSEFQVECVNSVTAKIKHLENCLDLLVEAKSIFKIMAEGETKVDDAKEIDKEDKAGRKNEESRESEDELNLLNLFEHRLQFVLLSLTKLTIGKTDGKRESNCLGETYKKLYAMTLKSNVSDRNPVELAKWFYRLVNEITKSLNPNR